MSPRPLIAVIGNNAISPAGERERIAEGLGRAIIEAGGRLVSGGMDGVMAAASRGARSASNYREGDVVGILPGTDGKQANPFVDIVIPSGMGLARNTLVALADAVIAVGGGAGTLSEIAYAWQFDRLTVAMRVAEGWSGRLADTRLDERVRFPNIPDDRVFGASDPEEAVKIVMRRLPAYRSGFSG